MSIEQRSAAEERPQVGCGARIALADGCSLRLLQDEDAEELQRLIFLNRPRLAEWMAWAATQQIDDTRRFIHATHRQLAQNDGFQTALLRPDGAIVGVVGFHGVDWLARSTSIGYWLDAGSEGRGTMTRAVRWLVDHALCGWRLERVEIRCAPENVRSRAIPDRLGFTPMRTLHRADRVGTRYLDSLVYELRAADWNGAGG